MSNASSGERAFTVAPLKGSITTVPSFSIASNASRTGDRLTLNIFPSWPSGKLSRLEGFIKNRISDLLNDQKRRFLDLLFIFASLLDERISHKFKLSCWPSCKCRVDLEER